eukprot:TRINITY_DN2680_c0_g1_i2.p3 TRINITY_DN2680_c0_g1~~TRINITY_DN2680_c0_g1_i2.p3  ORF type:complete len:129 (-),score=59.27 TRINITY_DN2680_c0_g1_i2:82-468(-)
MKSMRKGEMALMYHSNCKQIGVVGVMKVVRESYPDYTQFDKTDAHYDPKAAKDKPRWFMVDVGFVQKFKRLVSLAELRTHPVLSDMLILRRGNRLSITPITKAHFDYIRRLADSPAPPATSTKKGKKK